MEQHMTSDDSFLTDHEPETDSLEELRDAAAERGNSQTLDASDPEDQDNWDAPLGELPTAGEFIVAVIPQQPDEFCCSRCHLVLHRSRRIAADINICSDCD
jgi:hypothetical protein